jgi:hypothetical protein
MYVSFDLCLAAVVCLIFTLIYNNILFVYKSSISFPLKMVSDKKFSSADLNSAPRVVTEEKNSPTVAHACRKRRLKWVPGS